MSDKLDLIDEEILRAVRGQDSGWTIDDKYPAKGRTWKERYNEGNGDRQALLWAIEECGEKGEPIPTWAHIALRRRALDAARGQFKNWDGAFGKIMVKRKGRAEIKRLSEMAMQVGEYIEQQHSKGKALDDTLWLEVQREFRGRVGRGLIKKYWRFYRELKRRST
jgi:hypothetical protein